MKLSYNWIKRYFEMADTTRDEYRDALNRAGFTIEAEAELKAADGKVSEDNVVWDVEIPEARDDQQCMMWVAKESCGIFQRYFARSVYYGEQQPDFEPVLQKTWEERHNLYLGLTLHSETPECTLLQGRVVNHVDNTLPTPAFILDEVYALGYEPADLIANIAVYEGRSFGEPMWFLDLAAFPTREITVREAGEQGHLTYEGKRYNYEPDDMVFVTDGKVIGLAGVLWDDSVRVTEGTTGIIVLSGVFGTDSARRVARRLGFNTQMGSIVSCGTNYGTVTKIVDNGASYLNAYADGDGFEAMTTLTLCDTQRRFIRISVSEINDILDSDYEYEEIKTAIDNAELLVLEPDEEHDSFYIKLPSYRNDRYACDVAQSLLAWAGYDRIGARLR